MANFVVGQRWVSETEPELGLGTLVEVDRRQIEILFRGSGERRRYTVAAAPLRRIRFRPGESITNRDGERIVVERVEEIDGLLVYLGNGSRMTESVLADSLAGEGAEAQLRRGQVDDGRAWAVRVAALQQQFEIRRSPVRGLLGGRIDLLPHQIYIADEVSRRHAPRVLLADEVGLGKTIEACLTLHRMLRTGRANRALILVPESLLYQWFVELLRRFDLGFRIYDEKRCRAIEEVNVGANPFLDEQLILASLDLLTNYPDRADQALEAGWDVCIVDEVHRLALGDKEGGKGYEVVAGLAARTPSLLLLTATPEQLGEESHFARLRMLDPARFHDFPAYKASQERFSALAEVIDRVVDGDDLRPRDLESDLFATPELRARAKNLSTGGGEERENLVSDLIDRHGTGRVLFRNTRTAVPGFRARVAHLYPLAGGTEEADLGVPDYEEDPRLHWLIDFLRKRRDQKVLLICNRREQAEAIETALEAHLRVPHALFHEGLSLVQRDRNAAFFADEKGAQLLLCSEIGSEGRNFQQAHHLVLFDLPLDPELLEQRIGRLDRLGQTADVHVHVPYLSGTTQEIVARWHHEGLGAYERSLPGAAALREQLHPALTRVIALRRTQASNAAAELDDLIRTSRATAAEVAEMLLRGRDRLLERSSLRPALAASLIEQIVAEDRDPDLEEFLLRIFDCFGVGVEDLAARTWRLDTDHLYVDAFPALPETGLSLTFDRNTALEREDLVLLTRDHPMVIGGIELLLGSEKGRATFAFWEDSATQSLLLEAYWILEAITQTELAADRFLPPTPIRVVVNEKGANQSMSLDAATLDRRTRSENPGTFLERPEFTARLLPSMVSASRQIAAERSQILRAAAIETMTATLRRERDRLQELRQLGGLVRPGEISAADEEIVLLEKGLGEARLRLDNLRLIWRGSRRALVA